jgi:hypothetical protein
MGKKEEEEEEEEDCPLADLPPPQPMEWLVGWRWIGPGVLPATADLPPPPCLLAIPPSHRPSPVIGGGGGEFLVTGARPAFLGHLGWSLYGPRAMFLSLADINKVGGAKNGSKKEIEEAAKPTRGK